MMTNRLPLALALALSVAGCDNKTTSAADMAMAGPPGGPVAGAMDTHCNIDGGVRSQAVDPATCKYKPDGGAAAGEYGDTLFGGEGNDDDCKYHVMWSATTPVYQNTDVTLMVMLSTLADGKAAMGAAPYAEAFLSDTHGAPATQQKVTEESPGHYMISPVRFDASGKWTVRFHFHDDCFDYAEESPHGHAAFYVNVP